MAFNSQSFHRNKARRRAKEYLAEAREAKKRGDFRYVASRVNLARLSWRGYLSYCRLDQMDADMWRYRKGEMSYAEFMAKWGRAKPALGVSSGAHAPRDTIGCGN